MKSFVFIIVIFFSFVFVSQAQSYRLNLSQYGSPIFIRDTLYTLRQQVSNNGGEIVVAKFDGQLIQIATQSFMFKKKFVGCYLRDSLDGLALHVVEKYSLKKVSKENIYLLRYNLVPYKEIKIGDSPSVENINKSGDYAKGKLHETNSINSAKNISSVEADILIKEFEFDTNTFPILPRLPHLELNALWPSRLESGLKVLYLFNSSDLTGKKGILKDKTFHLAEGIINEGKCNYTGYLSNAYSTLVTKSMKVNRIYPLPDSLASAETKLIYRDSNFVYFLTPLKNSHLLVRFDLEREIVQYAVEVNIQGDSSSISLFHYDTGSKELYIGGNNGTKELFIYKYNSISGNRIAHYTDKLRFLIGNELIDSLFNRDIITDMTLFKDSSGTKLCVISKYKSDSGHDMQNLREFLIGLTVINLDDSLHFLDGWNLVFPRDTSIFYFNQYNKNSPLFKSNGSSAVNFAHIADFLMFYKIQGMPADSWVNTLRNHYYLSPNFTTILLKNSKLIFKNESWQIQVDKYPEDAVMLKSDDKSYYILYFDGANKSWVLVRESY